MKPLSSCYYSRSEKAANVRASWIALGLVLVLTPVSIAQPPEASVYPDKPATLSSCERETQRSGSAFECLPFHLLWQPPLADPRQPRLYVKMTSLENRTTKDTIDTALGGTIGVIRYHPPGGDGLEVQLDFFGVHFSRWTERHLMVGGDYRYGLPITFRWGSFEGKIGYEHTSTHVGDDHLERFGQFREAYVRDELVFGLAYRWQEQWRLYGQYGLAFSMSSPVPASNGRCSWGLEWSRQAPTGWHGQPFAAFDMDLRPEQDYRPNVCLQLGWQWLAANQRSSFRAALEVYDGYSTFGQFLTNKESWIGIGLYADF